MTVGQKLCLDAARGEGSHLRSLLRTNQGGLLGRGNPALGALELGEVFVSGWTPNHCPKGQKTNDQGWQFSQCLRLLWRYGGV